MKNRSFRLGLLFCLAPLLACAATSSTAADWRFEVTIKQGLAASPKDGRLYVILGRTQNPEPRRTLGQTGRDAPQVLAHDLKSFGPGVEALATQQAFAYPITNPANVPAGDYFVQALFDSNADLRLRDAPGNLYSKPQQIHLDPAQAGEWKLELTEQIPEEKLPAETAQLKFVKIQSKLLSDFYGRPIFLRAGIVLPRDYDQNSSRRYPLWVRIGGFDTRYTVVIGEMGRDSGFARTWQADDTPRLILLQLDGAGPNGDPYYVNSANHGPFGDALVQELIPQVEAQFRAIGQPRARFLSGVSTGGWVSFALQVFYPDFFNGTWSSCPDPVDFRAFELVNLYEDDNAYVNRFGNERPSERTLNGDVQLTMRREVGVENLLGRGNSYTLSGGQWGDWNAVFGPRGTDGLPVPVWDPQTGKINHAVAEQWKKYDLRLVLEQNWTTLGPKLRGKIHIAAGEADNYFLNNAVHLLDRFLGQAKPPFEGKIVYGAGKGHGWFDLTLRQMLDEMQAAATTAK
jgi:hypothetical protein